MEYLAPSGRKRDVRYEVEGFYVAPDKIEQKEHGAVSFLRGRKVLRIDMKKKEVILDNNEKIGFEKCLIATGKLRGDIFFGVEKHEFKSFSCNGKIQNV